MPSYKSSHRPARRRGFDDDTFHGSVPAPSFAGFGGASAAPELTARVKWYNPDKGFGFAELTDGSGDVFLHANTLQAAGLEAASPGATLRVRVGQGQKGRQVDQVLSVDESTAAAEPPHRPGGQSHRGGRLPQRSPDLSAAVEMTGTVKWYNPEKGFGFIAVEGGGKDVFVHATALERTGIRTLQEGAVVRMQVVQGSKGLEAGSILEG